MKISVDDMMGELEIDTQKLFKYIRACYNPEDVFTVEELEQWARSYGYSDKEGARDDQKRV